MDMLQDEFLHILASNNVRLDIYQVYGSIRRGSMSLGGSNTGFEDKFNSYREEFDRSWSGFRNERGLSLGGDVNVRHDVLDECLVILGVEKLSIEEVQRIEWKVFDEKMKKWIQAVKVVVRYIEKLNQVIIDWQIWDVERISKKKTKNEAKTTKPDSEWKRRKDKVKVQAQA
ncbi:exocyst complex component EXO70B1 [Tanacetum coccineum]